MGPAAAYPGSPAPGLVLPATARPLGGWQAPWRAAILGWLACGWLGCSSILPSPAAATATPGQSTSPSADARSQPPDGFLSPQALIPEIGLWVDGLVQVGLAKKTGLVLWWDLIPGTSPAPRASKAIDWRRVTYRVRAEAYEASGRRRAEKEALVEPAYSDGSRERGGFPAPLRLALEPGRYRIHLEAYPLVSAAAAGLDSVPRGEKDVEVNVPEISVGSRGWRTSELLFLRSARPWEAGTAKERVWYDWAISPNAARAFAPDTAVAYVAFEILHPAEVVPRCAPGTCRVVITFRDAQGGIVRQELRHAPDAGSMSAYLIPFHLDDLAAGAYTVEVEAFEGRELLSSTRRGFTVLAPR